MQTTFADGIANITVTGPLVRIELGTATLVPNSDGKQDVRLVPSQQIVMPLEGFMRAVSAQEQIIRRLIADGVLKVQPAAETSPAPATAQ